MPKQPKRYVTARGEDLWRLRRSLRSNQVPNARARDSKRACRGPLDLSHEM